MTIVSYQINGRKERSAITAWENIISNRQGNTLSDFFLWVNNDVYDNVLWSLPPTHSIAYYEEEHAKKLRSQYSYVRVWYSGGSDSHSIVESFLRAGQKIDEIISVYWETIISSDIAGAGNQELVLGWLTELYQKYNQPLPKVTVLDVTKQHVDQHFSKNYFYKNIGFGGNYAFNLNQYDKMAQLKPINVPNFVEVFGMEKPRIVVENNSAFFQMNDKQLMQCAADDYPVEWFYLPRQTPDLIRAQLWGIIEYVKTVQTPVKFIQDLQRTDDLYHLWCKLCGRTTSPKQNMLSSKSKTFGSSVTHNGRKRYRHIHQSENEHSIAWENYRNFLNYSKELAQQWDEELVELPGVLTKKYFLTDL